MITYTITFESHNILRGSVVTILTLQIQKEKITFLMTYTGIEGESQTQFF